jgi:hypothetical protein
LLALLLLSSWVPNVAADPGNPEVVNTICSTWNSTSGICDDYNFADDETTAQEWIEGRYHVQMANATVMSVTLEWAIHEVRRDDVFLEDLPLGNGSDSAEDGIPADYLRNYMDYLTMGGVTVREALRSSVSSSVSAMIDNGFGTSSNVQTLYRDEITLEGGTIQCTGDGGQDSADEVAGLPNDAYNPPLCLRTTLAISVDPAQLGLTEAGLDVERAYQGLLTMGASVRTNMTLSALPGHLTSYEFVPPGYGTLSEIGGGGDLIAANDGGFDYTYARWRVDHRDATGDAWFNNTASITMDRRSTVTRAVDIDLENDTGLGIEVVVDATDERATSIEVILAFHHVGTATLSEWDWSMDDERISMPWVTSDGLRLAHHTNLANLSDLASKVPVDDLNQAALDYSPTPVTFSEFSFAPANGTGGLDFTHRPGVTCAEGSPSAWCIQGSNAMNGTNPVYLISRSSTFELDVGALGTTLSDDFGVDLMGFDPGLLTIEDRAVILNAMRISGSLDTGILTGWMGGDMPAADVTLTVLLPDYVRSTTGAPGVITLRHTTGEERTEEISLTGAVPYDWQHPICRGRGGCQGDEIDLVCRAQDRTCIGVDIDVDLQELDIHEWSQSADIVAKSTIEVNLYRLAVPQARIEEQTNVEIEVISSDFIRRAVDLGDRMDGGLAAPYAGDLMVQIGDDEIPIVLDRAGLHRFADEIGIIMEERINAEMSAMVEETNKDGELHLEVSHINVAASLSGLDLSPGATLDDRRPITVSIEVSKVTINAEYLGEDVQLTGAMNSWSNAMLRAGSLTPTAAQGDISGIELPRDEDIEITVIPPSQSFEDVLITPSIQFKITFPRGLGFSYFDSDLDRAKLTEAQGRQTLTYHVPICTGEVESDCEAEADTVRFKMVVGIEYILGQIAVYIGGLFGLILLLIFLRIRRKRNKRESMLDEEGERLAKLRVGEDGMLQDAYHDEDGLPEMGALPGLDSKGSIPGENWDGGYEDLLAFDDP